MTLRTRLLVGLGWLVSLLLLVLAANLRDPHLLPARSFALPVLLAAGAIGISIWLSVGRRWYCWLGSLLLLLAILLAGWNDYRFRDDKTLVLETRNADLQALGGHFIVGVGDPRTVEPLIRKGLVAGLFISARNVQGQSAEALRRQIGKWQALRRDAGLPPLIIAADQEGGIVSRLSPPLPKRPPLAALLATNPAPDALYAAAFDYGVAQGRELAELGVTLDFSPVVDLKPAQRARLDFHSAIALRAISPDPQVTTTVALAYVRGLEHSGVRATLKHFPGLGMVPEDTHHFSASLAATVGHLQDYDWRPFREIARQTDALIMLGHVKVTALDAVNPASFSAAVVQKIIREGWKHDGVLITDDLTMAAAYNQGLCHATVQALNAGVDLLLVSYDDEKIYPALACALRALEDGKLSTQRLQQSAQRLARTFAPPK
ncbi:glycoside hydrolase family 3 N-terminal domain-containing protein [Pseudomonas sp. SCB32]|uniref:glycoside hydrolase family 3 N-terminal domain-containing protein n=1 Tax=Pseudomonas sp. SCB32 TaxID=2653853 RepID=UPI00126430A6|nr:glycoside hydrolase family 3 N-terminal domain-containing protein [Pseudomonas sp. SCB32]